VVLRTNTTVCTSTTSIPGTKNTSSQQIPHTTYYKNVIEEERSSSAYGISTTSTFPTWYLYSSTYGVVLVQDTYLIFYYSMPDIEKEDDDVQLSSLRIYDYPSLCLYQPGVEMWCVVTIQKDSY
jgi:hypothetical protein